MKLEEFQRLGQTVKTFTSKLHENPGKFVAIVTQMHLDMKAERDTLIDDLKVLREKNEKLKNRAENAMELAERSNCGVLKLERENAQLKEKNEKLERENKRQHSVTEQFKHDLQYTEWEIVPHLKKENEKLRAEKFGLKLNLIESTKLGDGFLKRYEHLTDHIRLKASANPGEHRYIALVNFIDRLEQK